MTGRSVGTATMDEQQRERLVDLIVRDPYTGHVKAARQAGINGTAGEIRQLLATDEQFQETLASARADMLDAAGLTVKQLLDRLAWIVNDNGNSSQLRAIQQALSFHGIHLVERAQVEHTGEINHAGTVRVEHERRVTLADVVDFVRPLDGPGTGDGRQLPAAPGLLAAPEPD